MPALSSTTSILPFFKAIIKYTTPVPNSANDWLLNIYENCRFMVCVNNLKFLVYLVRALVRAAGDLSTTDFPAFFRE